MHATREGLGWTAAIVYHCRADLIPALFYAGQPASQPAGLTTTVPTSLSLYLPWRMWDKHSYRAAYSSSSSSSGIAPAWPMPAGKKQRRPP